MLIHQEDLINMQCSNPDCDHQNCTELYIHQQCHTGDGVYALYDKVTGALGLFCRTCGEPVLGFQVAHSGESIGEQV